MYDTTCEVTAGTCEILEKWFEQNFHEDKDPGPKGKMRAAGDRTNADLSEDICGHLVSGFGVSPKFPVLTFDFRATARSTATLCSAPRSRR